MAQRRKRGGRGSGQDRRQVTCVSSARQTSPHFWECEVCGGKSPGFVRITATAGLSCCKNTRCQRSTSCIPPLRRFLLTKRKKTNSESKHHRMRPRPDVELCISRGSKCANRAATEVPLCALCAAVLLHQSHLIYYWDVS